jgi:hypothetical protein
MNFLEFCFGADKKGDRVMAKKNDEDRLNIQGGVHTDGGDFVGRDKVIRGENNSVVIGGNASGNMIVSGNGHVVGNTADGTLEDLRALLQQMQALLPQAGLDEDTVEVIEADFEVVEKQLAKSEPKKSIVLPKMESIVGTLATTVAAGEAIQKLVPMVQQAIAWVKMVM